MIEITVIIVLLCYIIFQNVQGFYERKNLTNKIMSRDYNQYASHELNEIEIKRKKFPRDEELMSL